MNEQSDFSPLHEIIREQVSRKSAQTLFTFLADGETESAHLTYGDIDLQARRIAARLQQRCVPGDRAILLYPPGLETIAAFVGCLYSGVVAVPSPPLPLTGPPETLLGIVADSEPKCVLTAARSRGEHAKLFGSYPSLKKIDLLATDDLDAEIDPRTWRPPTIRPDALAYLLYTSGSTKMARGVMTSHRSLVQSVQLVNYTAPADALTVTWLPQYHNSGFSAAGYASLITGVPLVFMPPDAFLQHPIRWLKTITRFRGTSSGGPNFGYQLCVERISPPERQGLDLSSWKSAWIGMEPIQAKTLDQFTEAFAPHGFKRKSFVSAYGLAESRLSTYAFDPKSCIIKRSALEENRVVAALQKDGDSLTIASCGAPTVSSGLSIVDPDSLTVCPPDRVGEIWISGALSMEGYLNKSSETKETFGAYLADTGAGPYLRSGDMGFLKDGELYITGRLKDMIIVRGRNYHAVDIEQAAERAHPDLMPGAAAAFGIYVNDEERVVLMHEIKPKAIQVNVEQTAQAIRRVMAEDLGLPVHAIILVKAGSLPRTGSGKIQRYLARAQFLASDLASSEQKKT